MKLFAMRGSCALSCHIALEWAGAEYELEMLDREALAGDAYRAVNPKAQVPALLLDDGQVISEALAILLLIAERYPEAHLKGEYLPLSRARLDEAMAGLVSDVHKAFGPVFVPARYTTDETALDSVKAAAFIQVDAQFDRLEAAMGGHGWLLGSRTVADAYLYVMTRWKRMTPTPIEAYPALAAFQARMDQNPAVRRTLLQEDPA